MLLSPEAAGVGLNITGANHVIHYTRLWNPAKEDQATDRVYRIGQTRDVNVYYPVAVSEKVGKTIEEHLHELLTSKRDLMREFLTPTTSLEVSSDDLWEKVGSESPIVERQVLSVDDLYGLTAEQYVNLISIIFQKDGYRTEITDRVADYGIHIVAFNRDGTGDALIHCKKIPGSGLSDIDLSSIVAARTHYQEIFDTTFPRICVITNSEVEREFRKSADKQKVETLDRSNLKKSLKSKGITYGDIFSDIQ